MQMKIILMIKCLASTSISCPNEYESLMEMVQHMYFHLALKEKLQKKLQLIEIAWLKHSLIWFKIIMFKIMLARFWTQIYLTGIYVEYFTYCCR